MNRFRSPLLFVLLNYAALSPTAASQNPASTACGTGVQASAATSDQTDHSSFRVAEGSVLHVVLAKNVDAKKNKVSDEVLTTTVEDLKSNGQIIIPHDSKVIGHIAEIQARSKGNPRSLIAIAFDRLVGNGVDIPLSASIQAVAPPETAAADENEPSRGNGGMSGSVGQPAGPGTRGGSPSGADGRTPTTGVAGTPSGADTSGGGYGRDSSSTRISAASQGVLGLKGLSLTAQDAAAHISVISSDHQNVHLEHGTQFVLRVKAN